MSISGICSHDIVCARRDASVRAAARLMREFHVGSLVVIDEADGRRRPVGIVTDRDVAVAVVAPGLDPDAIQTGEIMNAELVSVSEEAGVAEVGRIMRTKGMRRVVVTDGAGYLAGIVTADDILTLLAEEMSDLSAMVMHGQWREAGIRKAVA